MSTPWRRPPLSALTPSGSARLGASFLVCATGTGTASDSGTHCQWKRSRRGSDASDSESLSAAAAAIIVVLTRAIQLAASFKLKYYGDSDSSGWPGEFLSSESESSRSLSLAGSSRSLTLRLRLALRVLPRLAVGYRTCHRDEDSTPVAVAATPTWTTTPLGLRPPSGSARETQRGTGTTGTGTVLCRLAGRVTAALIMVCTACAVLTPARRHYSCTDCRGRNVAFGSLRLYASEYALQFPTLRVLCSPAVGYGRPHFCIAAIVLPAVALPSLHCLCRVPVSCQWRLDTAPACRYRRGYGGRNACTSPSGLGAWESRSTTCAMQVGPVSATRTLTPLN